MLMREVFARVLCPLLFPIILHFMKSTIKSNCKFTMFYLLIVALLAKFNTISYFKYWSSTFLILKYFKRKIYIIARCVY